ncbi:hypothetical protein [Staphylococcus phage vB_SsapH-Golestan-100]|nr:hypothetical protein [Staphylococcus phage vB_SsapH-Golestan-100]
MLNTEQGITLENLDYHRLHWLSDWDGHEVGFSDSDVISHYMHGELNLYIDTETDTVLEMWFDEEEL